MIYRAVRALILELLELFYRRLEVAGLDRVPAHGPLLIVANHHNALVDPMLLLATIPRRLVPVAKAPLFRHPLIAPFLWMVGALPVHRRQDAAGGADAAARDRNAAMIARAVAALRRERAILIFPEGVSQPEPTLMPLRTGAARIALGADAAIGEGPGVTILPVGLVYRRPGAFRAGRAVVHVGNPLVVDRARPHRGPSPAARERSPGEPATEGSPGDPATEGSAAEPPTEVVKGLTERMTAALRELIVEAADRETLELLHLVDRIWRPGLDEDRPGRGASQAARLQNLIRARRHLAEVAPGRLAAFQRRLERYARDLERAGLEGHVDTRWYRPRSVFAYALREGLSLAFELPLALWGIAQHAIPYRLTALTVRLLRPDSDVEATSKIAAGVVLFPVCWILEALLAWRLGGPVAAALFAGTLLPAGLLALGWHERLARVRRDARGYLGFLADRDLHRLLGARRRALRRELEALADLVPAHVLARIDAR
jgi:1-acyl-sn-glycerol-3-phosphate acyltransferase